MAENTDWLKDASAGTSAAWKRDSAEKKPLKLDLSVTPERTAFKQDMASEFRGSSSPPDDKGLVNRLTGAAKAGPKDSGKTLMNKIAAPKGGKRK